ncbi:MAG: sterol desaturase family protein [Desulfobacterales bacterium]
MDWLSDSNMLSYIKISSMTVSLLIFYLLETVSSFYPQAEDRTLHGLSNILIAVINALLIRFLLTGLMLFFLTGTNPYFSGFLGYFEFPFLLGVIVSFLFLDMLTYFWHRINHQVRFFWMFHRAHHTDTHMDATTAFRFHPGEIVFSVFFRLPFLILMGISLTDLLLYEIILNISVIFHHSNWSFSGNTDFLLRKIIVTPYMHRYHHSANMKECSSNYSSVFSFWDRIFGTYTRPVSPETVKIGLNILRDKKWQRPGGILRTPFL